MSERVRVSSSEVGETERLREGERESSDSQSRVCERVQERCRHPPYEIRSHTTDD